ncbi:hypothetical protein BDR22DRAFT_975124 [Usnea florida]
MFSLTALGAQTLLLIVVAHSVSSASLLLQNITNATSIHNITASSVVLCDPNLGVDLDKESCDNAIRKIERATGPVTFGERGTGNWDIVLPYRFLSDDGLCTVDVKSAAGHQPDVYTWGGVSRNAFRILDKCVGDQAVTTGGAVLNLGLEGELHLVLSKAVRTVQCPGSSSIAAPPYSSCQDLLSKLPVWTDQTMFGRAGAPGVQIKLPKIFYSGDNECALAVGLNPGNASDTATWTGIWDAAVQGTELCAKNGSPGVVDAFGDHRGLKIILFRPESATAVAVS